MSEGFTVSARQTGRPAALTGDRERECYELLERLGIAYEWVEFSRQPETTAEAEEVDKALGVPGLKNLIFQNRNRSRTLFLLLPREKRLDAKALAKSRNITRLSMVNAAALEDLLHTHAGAVGAMELMYDMEGKLELFIDREVLNGLFVRFPPNADGRLVRIATSDFVDKLLPAIKHGYTVLEADDPAFTGAEILPEAPFAFRKMRRSRQQLRLSESRAILERNTCGVLALARDGGYPYALPMSYAYREGKIYFHAARTGHKIDAIARCPKASFCVVDQDKMRKKRANGEGSIRKKPNGRWEGRYTQGIDPVTGRAVQKSVSARTQAECKEKLARAIRDNRGIPVNYNEDYTVADWCRLWFETYSKPVIRSNTAKTYANAIENHIIPALGGIKLKRLTSIQVQQFYNDSRTSGRVQRWKDQTNTALTGSSVRRIHMVLSSALKQAVKERLIPYNPCDNCRIPPKEKKEMTILPPEKLGAYLREAEQYGVLPMFFLELSSGLRRGELLALRWDDLDTENRILSVSRQVTRVDGELVATEPKTRNSIRRVALSRQAVELLVREHEQHPDNPLLFPSPRTGGYWSPDAVSRINRKLLAKAGIEEHVRFHDLRHTFATMALSSGVDVKTLSSMLGHYSAGFTLDTYTHITSEMQRGAAEKIGGFMETATARPEPEPPEPTEDGECKVIPFERVG